MELVKLTHENLEQEHICCAISKPGRRYFKQSISRPERMRRDALRPLRPFPFFMTGSL